MPVPRYGGHPAWCRHPGTGATRRGVVTKHSRHPAGSGDRGGRMAYGNPCGERGADQLHAGLGRTHRPGTPALGGLDALGHGDLLLAARVARRAGAAVRCPGRRGELQATGEAVAGVDGPVAAGLALGDPVPHGGAGGGGRGGRGPLRRRGRGLGVRRGRRLGAGPVRGRRRLLRGARGGRRHCRGGRLGQVVGVHPAVLALVVDLRPVLGRRPGQRDLRALGQGGEPGGVDRGTGADVEVRGRVRDAYGPPGRARGRCAAGRLRGGCRADRGGRPGRRLGVGGGGRHADGERGQPDQGAEGTSHGLAGHVPPGDPDGGRADVHDTKQ
ncbi:hypothetical protein SDC9_74353 [bioreactor metagenome]|uniref:Uncharacterized protein n=1 Tax=bioreactor metagenome TaxID=1076179 RepID=A0A644YHN8_9ZZZZ